MLSEEEEDRGQYELDDAISDFTVKRFEAYDSDTYALMSEGVADMHCRSDEKWQLMERIF